MTASGFTTCSLTPMMTTWGNQFIASTSMAICAQRLYQNNGRHFRGVGGNKRVGLARLAEKKLRDDSKVVRVTGSKTPYPTCAASMTWTSRLPMVQGGRLYTSENCRMTPLVCPRSQRDSARLARFWMKKLSSKAPSVQEMTALPASSLRR